MSPGLTKRSEEFKTLLKFIFRISLYFTDPRQIHFLFGAVLLWLSQLLVTNLQVRFSRSMEVKIAYTEKIMQSDLKSISETKECVIFLRLEYLLETNELETNHDIFFHFLYRNITS